MLFTSFFRSITMLCGGLTIFRQSHTTLSWIWIMSRVYIGFKQGFNHLTSPRFCKTLYDSPTTKAFHGPKNTWHLTPSNRNEWSMMYRNKTTRFQSWIRLSAPKLTVIHMTTKFTLCNNKYIYILATFWHCCASSAWNFDQATTSSLTRQQSSRERPTGPTGLWPGHGDPMIVGAGPTSQETVGIFHMVGRYRG